MHTELPRRFVKRLPNEHQRRMITHFRHVLTRQISSDNDWYNKTASHSVCARLHVSHTLTLAIHAANTRSQARQPSPIRVSGYRIHFLVGRLHYCLVVKLDMCWFMRQSQTSEKLQTGHM